MTVRQLAPGNLRGRGEEAFCESRCISLVLVSHFRSFLEKKTSASPHHIRRGRSVCTVTPRCSFHSFISFEQLRTRTSVTSARARHNPHRRTDRASAPTSFQGYTEIYRGQTTTLQTVRPFLSLSTFTSLPLLPLQDPTTIPSLLFVLVSRAERVRATSGVLVPVCLSF